MFNQLHFDGHKPAMNATVTICLEEVPRILPLYGADFVCSGAFVRTGKLYTLANVFQVV